MKKSLKDASLASLGLVWVDDSCYLCSYFYDFSDDPVYNVSLFSYPLTDYRLLIVTNIFAKDSNELRETDFLVFYTYNS